MQILISSLEVEGEKLRHVLFNIGSGENTGKKFSHEGKKDGDFTHKHSALLHCWLRTTNAFLPHGTNDLYLSKWELLCCIYYEMAQNTVK